MVKNCDQEKVTNGNALDLKGSWYNSYKRAMENLIWEYFKVFWYNLNCITSNSSHAKHHYRRFLIFFISQLNEFIRKETSV